MGFRERQREGKKERETLTIPRVVSRHRPADPLRVLGEFLLQRSKEVEGTANGTGGANGDEGKESDKNTDE